MGHYWRYTNIALPEGKYDPRQSCLIAKAKREVINKESHNKSTIPGEQLMIDISYVCGRHQEKKKVKGNCFWLLIVDEATSMKWSYFLPQKDCQVKTVINLVKALRVQKPGSVKYIRWDNTVENQNLKKKMQDEGLGVTFNYRLLEMIYDVY